MSMTAMHHLPDNRQRGGTVAGLLIGLIAGLIIAAVVAMTILKSPLPFVEKIGRQTPATGELGDPNKSLPGRAPESREPATNPTANPTANADADTAAEADMSAPLAGPPVDEPAAPKKPALKPAPTKAPPGAGSAPAATSSSAADGFTYFLQAGAFREPQDAEATRARLALLGVAASIVERKSDLGTLYRVRVGPFTDVERMNRARAQLSDNGVDVAVVRIPK